MNGQPPPQPNVSQTEQQPSSESSAFSPISSNERPEGKKGLLFEILFVVIILILVFGILNYFNILRISDLFPNQLGFLPHKPYEQSLVSETSTPIKQQASKAIVPTAESAKKVLIEVLPNILIPSLIPNTSQIVVKPDKHIKEVLKESWETNQGTISATLFTLPDEKNIASLHLFITKEENATPSPELAETTTTQLFVVTPKGEWGCKPLNQNVYCENFWEEENGVRRGIAVNGPFLLPDKKQVNSYSFCEHHKENIGLYTWKSCRSEFAKSGVR